jgi:hypothetical protein
MSKKLTFKIDREGNVKIENVEGYGSSCLEATKFIEGMLGSADESSRKLTEEYHGTVSTTGSDHISH